MKNLAKMMQQAKQMQENMQQVEKGLQAMQITGEAGAGMVKVTGNGKHEVSKIEFDAEVLSEDKQVIEELTAAAINDYVQKIAKDSKSWLTNIASEMMPADFPFDFGDNNDSEDKGK